MRKDTTAIKAQKGETSVWKYSSDVCSSDLVLTYFQEVALWSPEVQLAFVIDCGLEEHSALACKEWCNQKNRLIFCTQKEFEDICKGFQDRVY